MELVGSTAINGEGNDIDVAVDLSRLNTGEIFTISPNDVISIFQRFGCTTQGGAHYETVNLDADDQFTSMRFQNFNFLLCFNERSWDRFTLGRDICMYLREIGIQLDTKQKRIAIHALVSTLDVNEIRRQVERVN